MGRLRAGFVVLLVLAAVLWISPQAMAAPAGQSGVVQPGQSVTGGFAGSEKCASCHKEAVDAAGGSLHAKPAHGGAAVGCEGCHGNGEAHVESGGDPASIANPGKLSSAARNAVCGKCHAKEAGSFAHEHPVVNIEGCTACHAPHGSANAHMLTVSDVNSLCQQCHSMAAAAAGSDGPAHDKAAQSKPCTNCHAHVHGSNVSNLFFK